LIFEYVSKICGQKFKIHQNLTRITGVLYEAQRTFLTIPRSAILKMGTALDKVVEKIKTHILYSIIFFENHAVYEIMWKSTVEPGRPQDDNMAHVHCVMDT
jgi:hypothetical protein